MLRLTKCVCLLDVGGNFEALWCDSCTSLSVMSTTPGYRLTSPSTSPLYGPSSVFAHEMVRHNGPTLSEVETILPAISHYKLDELISGTDSIDGDGEEKASNWISKLLTNAQKKRLHAEPKIALPKLENFQGFIPATHIWPDVVLLTNTTCFPIMTVEVISQTYKQTLKKALINGIELLRIFRAYDSTVDESIGFVLPNEKTQSFITKVEVKFSDLTFKYTFSPIEKEDAVSTIKAAIQGKSTLYRSTPSESDVYPYFIQLSGNECSQFGIGALQEKSKSLFLPPHHTGNTIRKCLGNYMSF